MNPQFESFKKLLRKIEPYIFPAKVAIFIAILILCVVVLIVRLTAGWELNSKMLLGIGMVFTMAAIGLWATFREEAIERQKSKRLYKHKK